MFCPEARGETRNECVETIVSVKTGLVVDPSFSAQTVKAGGHTFVNGTV